MFDSMFPSHWSTLRKLMWLKLKGASAVWETISGNPVSFTAKAAPLRKLSVAFSPVQSLNGYDSPWPAGGGKNKYSDVWSEYTKPYEYYVRPITLEQGDWVLSGELTGTDITGCVVGIVKAGTKYSEFVSLRATLNVSGGVETHSLAVDSTWTDPHLVIYCTGETQFNSLFSNYHFQLEKSSTASSYAPYSNECPISGWDSLHVYDDPLYAGVIEWNQISRELSDAYWGGATFADGVATFTAAARYSGPFTKSAGNIETVTGHKYFYGFQVKPTTNNTAMRIITGVPNAGLNVTPTASVSGEWNSLYAINEAQATGTGSFALQDNRASDWDELQARYAMFIDLTSMFGAGNEPATVEAFKALFPHDYYPYNAGTETLVGTVNGMETRSISISLGETVYSGTVDVVTGVGEVTMVSQDMGTLGWAYGAATMCFTAASGVGGLEAFANGRGTREGCMAFCSRYKRLTDGRGSIFAENDKCFSFNKNANGGAINGNFQAGVLIVKDTAYDNKDTFKAAMSGVQMVYELLDPIPITLTPQEVESLLGENNMWSNANQPITVEYRKN